MVDRAGLLGAGGHGGPGPLAIVPPLRAAGALGHVTVDDHETNGLLGQVVGRIDRPLRLPRRPGHGDEPEVGLSMQAEAVGQVLGLVALRGALAHGEQFVPRLFQGPLEACRVHLVPPVDHVEQLAAGPPAPAGHTPPSPDPATDKELHVADQVGQAELDPHVAEVQVFAVGREIVAAQQAVEFLAQQLQEHLRAAGLVDLEEGEELRPQAPGPPRLAVVLVPGLIDVEPFLAGQEGREFLVRPLEGLRHLAEHLGQLPARDRHPQHIAAELADRGKRRVAYALEVGDQGRQPRPHQSGGLDFRAARRPARSGRSPDRGRVGRDAR